LTVRQNDVSARVKLDQNVVRRISATKHEIDDAIDLFKKVLPRINVITINV
jgi:hypothetical protein